jgi:hypothetical protein
MVHVRLGKLTVTCSTHSGALFGTRFWKKKSPSAPFGKRFIDVGRSCMCSRSGSAIAR